MLPRVAKRLNTVLDLREVKFQLRKNTNTRDISRASSAYVFEPQSQYYYWDKSLIRRYVLWWHTNRIYYTRTHCVIHVSKNVRHCLAFVFCAWTPLRIDKIVIKWKKKWSLPHCITSILLNIKCAVNNDERKLIRRGFTAIFFGVVNHSRDSDIFVCSKWHFTMNYKYTTAKKRYIRNFQWPPPNISFLLRTTNLSFFTHAATGKILCALSCS